jgi:hypothetical protein
MVFRVFQKTMMHEHSHFLRRDRVFFWDDGIGIPWRYYDGPSAGLEVYLSMGWPKGAQGARWKDGERIVEIFIDELFLCPKCGEFSIEDEGVSDLVKAGMSFKGEGIVMPNGREMDGVTVECEEEVRRFCESRLKSKEFYFKECNDQELCEKVRANAMHRFRRDYGSKGSNARPLVSLPVAEIKTPRSPERLPWDEGYIYLVRCGAFHKIGLAKDAHKRLSRLKTSSPFEMELVKNWRCKKPDTIEGFLHERFKKFRVRGEWFNLPEDAVQLLLKLHDLNAEFPVDETE